VNAFDVTVAYENDLGHCLTSALARERTGLVFKLTTLGALGIPGRISMVADLGPLRMVGVSSAAETKRSAKSERFIGRRALAAR
jgi:hypothetical protein